jgi:phosphatidylglycerophosphate synthase
MSTSTTSNAPTQPRRELRSLTAAAEKRVLLWIAARLPSWIGSDHLTLLGLVAMAGAGVSYWLSGSTAMALHAVNACLVLNWLGDSLDGTLARHRNRLRPRYGFYVDHIVDAFGALFVLAGLGASGLMRPELACGLLVAYYLMSINMYLAACSLGVFKMSFGRVGGTELRILLASLNLAALARPSIAIAGERYALFDLCGALGLAGLLALVVVETLRNTAALYRAERLEPQA